MAYVVMVLKVVAKGSGSNRGRRDREVVMEA